MKLPTVKTRRCVKYVDSEGKSLRERISVERGIDGKSVIRMKSLYYVVLDVHKWAVEPLCQNVTTSYHLLFSFWVDVTENTERGTFCFHFFLFFKKSSNLRVGRANT